jgi:hypothetical protein
MAVLVVSLLVSYGVALARLAICPPLMLLLLALVLLPLESSLLPFLRLCRFDVGVKVEAEVEAEAGVVMGTSSSSSSSSTRLELLSGIGPTAPNNNNACRRLEADRRRGTGGVDWCCLSWDDDCVVLAVEESDELLAVRLLLDASEPRAPYCRGVIVAVVLEDDGDAADSLGDRRGRRGVGGRSKMEEQATMAGDDCSPPPPGEEKAMDVTLLDLRERVVTFFFLLGVGVVGVLGSGASASSVVSQALDRLKEFPVKAPPGE